MTERSPSERVFDAFRVLNHEMAITANTDGYFTWTSAGVSELLGWNAEELCSCKFIEYVHPDDVERTLAVADQVRPDGSSVSRFENRYRCRDGSYRWLEWRAVTIGKETRCLVRDITGRKAAEQQAVERLEWLKMAERLAGVGHWRLRLADNHLEWSDEVFRIHGLDPLDDSIDLDTAIEFYHPDDRANVSHALNVATEQKCGFAFELRIVRRDENVRTVRAIGQCNIGENGSVAELFGVFIDVTEQGQTSALHALQAAVKFVLADPGLDPAHTRALRDALESGRS